MIRRALLISALTVTGVAAFASNTFAQTVNVPFNGTVGAVCSFGQPTPGTLGLNTPTSPTALAGGYSGGVFGQVSVSCNQPARVSISKPVQTAGPSFTPVTSAAMISSSFGSTDSNGAPPLSLSSSGTVPLKIDMIVDKGSPLAAGNYSYVTTLTIVP